MEQDRGVVQGSLSGIVSRRILRVWACPKSMPSFGLNGEGKLME